MLGINADFFLFRFLSIQLLLYAAWRVHKIFHVKYSGKKSDLKTFLQKKKKNCLRSQFLLTPHRLYLQVWVFYCLIHESTKNWSEISYYCLYHIYLLWVQHMYNVHMYITMCVHFVYYVKAISYSPIVWDTWQ